MAKRGFEESPTDEDIAGPSKRSRLAIADLLGSEGGEPSTAGYTNSGPGQNANEEEILQYSRSHEGDPSNPNLDHQPTSNGRAANSSITRNRDTTHDSQHVVYIARHRHKHEYGTDEAILGVYSDVKKANEVVQRAFLGNHNPGDDNDDRQRYYGSDGTLSCSFKSEDIGEPEMEFWVEQHVVDDGGLESADAEATAAEFEEAFDGFEDEE